MNGERKICPHCGKSVVVVYSKNSLIGLLRRHRVNGKFGGTCPGSSIEVSP